MNYYIIIIICLIGNTKLIINGHYLVGMLEYKYFETDENKKLLMIVRPPYSEKKKKVI